MYQPVRRSVGNARLIFVVVAILASVPYAAMAGEVTGYKVVLPKEPRTFQSVWAHPHALYVLGKETQAESFTLEDPGPGLHFTTGESPFTLAASTSLRVWNPASEKRRRLLMDEPTKRRSPARVEGLGAAAVAIATATTANKGKPFPLAVIGVSIPKGAKHGTATFYGNVLPGQEKADRLHVERIVPPREWVPAMLNGASAEVRALGLMAYASLDPAEQKSMTPLVEALGNNDHQVGFIVNWRFFRRLDRHRNTRVEINDIAGDSTTKRWGTVLSIDPETLVARVRKDDGGLINKGLWDLTPVGNQ